MSADIKAIAVRQLRDYDAHTPGTIFESDISLTLAEAYAVQREVARLRERRGEAVVGYKVGCTSPPIQRQLGVSEPVMGYLFDTEQYPNDATLAPDRFCGLAIEGEYAVRLSRDLPGQVEADRELLDCLEGMFPVIELHNQVFRAESGRVQELVANNAIHAGVVARSDAGYGRELGTADLDTVINQQRVASVSSPVSRQTILASLRWLAGTLRRDGTLLREGQMVLCGTAAGLYPVVAGDRVEVVAGCYRLACSVASMTVVDSNSEAT